MESSYKKNGGFIPLESNKQNFSLSPSLVKTRRTGFLTGFTLIELLVVAGILILLSALFLANYDTMKWQANLNAQTQKMISIIKEAQSLALTEKKIQNIEPLGYGVWFNYENGTDYYVLFADSPIGKTNEFDTNDPIIQTFSLPKEINLTFGLGVFPPISLIFPVSGEKIYKNGKTFEGTFNLKLTHIKSGNSKEIKINPYGRIEVSSK